MSAFSERFLRGDTRGGGWLRRLAGGGEKEPPAPVCVGAFGKHPGWDDHLDDINLQTETLALARQILYVEGIGGQLNAGAWDNLPDEARLPRFGHVFLWRRGGGEGTLAGRLWSSTDRKGRGRYPMVLCAEVNGPPLEWTLEGVLPRLEELEAACRATDDAEAVRALVEDAGQFLCVLAPGRGVGAPDPGPTWPAGWGGDASETVLRVLYCVRTQLGDFAPGRGANARPRTLRFSRPPDDDPAQTLRAWASVFDRLLDPGTPVLLLVPSGGGWLDAVVGEPASESFFCLRAGPSVLPPGDLVPYTLGFPWRVAAAGFLAGRPGGRWTPPYSARAFWRLPAD